jgi:glycine oxidase
MAETSNITIIGAGILGLWQAYSFAVAGFKVAVYDRQSRDLSLSASFLAGAMLAPDCELEAAEAIVGELGRMGIAIWLAEFPEIAQRGTLVIAHARDLAELDRFARAAPAHEWIDAAAIAKLEPDLEARFSRGLFYQAEGHINPREMMATLMERAEAKGAEFHFDVDGADIAANDGWLIDCRGIAAQDDLPDLRGVKGEMLVLHTDEVALSRPVRLMHPRHPLYIVPWGQGHYMIGATMIEADCDTRVTAKSVLELLSAAYTVHPAFGEAEIVEMRAGLRPAFADNLPRITRRGKKLFVNGIFRHGYLLAPVMADMTLGIVRNKDIRLEFIHED